jgi:cation:H+ antiporter
MEEALQSFAGHLHWSLLALWIAAAFLLLGKSADWLVGEAAALSETSGVPKVVIGATVVSLGTTSPEVSVSVLAAIQGNPGLALGNAVGSIICDTGLILGLAVLLAPLRIDRRVVDRQGWFQLAAGGLLIVSCIPWSRPAGLFIDGGRLPRAMGIVFLLLLAAYLWISVRWARSQEAGVPLDGRERDAGSSKWVIFGKLVLAVALVVAFARILIPGVEEAALRLHVPDSVVAATLVAFGTSLPELVTAVTAARRGHGELALGNVLGADVLNVLFVSGAAAAATPGGLAAGGHFFRLLFPAMLAILVILRVGIFASGDTMKRGFGVVLIAAYALVIALSYVFPGPASHAP